MQVKQEYKDIRVTPNKMHIGDIEGEITGNLSARFKPLGYRCSVSIGGYAINKLIKWAIRNGNIILNGELYYRNRTKIERIKGNG